ncbi:hypothetical protein LOTGIDRAFT_163760 [Lottia gigantea]|uniref:Uncharacterized protein n=1 Tax=Lottia gigantea TaxID=225164 RepID=V3ZHZ7_LOTGI|nr:hypothetical protein LOTGIDRAFT_163760 [Lottia gigantea]ESO90873.1 hypothetical protein LOTGIDRAFT_163760 [Lottia gigantea]
MGTHMTRKRVLKPDAAPTIFRKPRDSQDDVPVPKKRIRGAFEKREKAGSNECGGSYHMEKTGLERSLQVFDKNNLTAGILATDRHRQIAKWIRENYPFVLHLYDIWHVAKEGGFEA